MSWVVRKPPGVGGAKKQISEYGAETPEIPGKVCVTQGQPKKNAIGGMSAQPTTLQRTSHKPYLSTSGELGRAISHSLEFRLSQPGGLGGLGQTPESPQHGWSIRK